MKKIWIRVAILIVVVLGISASLTAVIGSRNEITAPLKKKEKEKEKLFHLIMNEGAIMPIPKIRTESAIVFDLDSGYVYTKKNEDSVRSIASLTKIATALVFLDTKPNFARIDTVTREDREGAGRSRLYSKTKATLDDIFHLMLICSDNVAARVIAKSTGLPPEEFVERMNNLALSKGLTHTHFVEPTGLDPGNVSTAAEMSILLKAALEKPKIREIMAKKDFTFRAVGGRRTYTVRNTNRLLFGRHDIIGGKTGYICEAGYCLALGFRGNRGQKLGAVLLGAPSSGTRFRDAARLVTNLAGPKPAAILARRK